MPSYTYFCESCNKTFEIFSSIREYKEIIKCDGCKSKCSRHYEDMLTLSNSVKKSDSELATIGDLANRNRDKLSSDEKSNLDKKHNQYKDQQLAKELPTGMSRIKKPNKIKWR